MNEYLSGLASRNLTAVKLPSVKRNSEYKSLQIKTMATPEVPEFRDFALNHIKLQNEIVKRQLNPSSLQRKQPKIEKQEEAVKSVFDSITYRKEHSLLPTLIKPSVAAKSLIDHPLIRESNSLDDLHNRKSIFIKQKRLNENS